MDDKEKLNKIQDNVVDVRTILNLLIKLVQNEDNAPACFDEVLLIFDGKLKKIEELF